MKKIKDEVIKKTCLESNSMEEACKELQVSRMWLKRKATQLGCWIPNKGGKNIPRPSYTHPRRIFTVEDWHADKLFEIARIAVLRNILKYNLIPYHCSECGLSEWNNKPITLDLDHINGNGKEHRKSNLRFLCPNCHSQTDTFRNKKRK